jgi:microcystin-dependent protein
MRRLVLAVAFFLQSSLAWAGCSVGALPFILQNNTIADATQVMANFNQITSGIQANCAAAGINLDITSLGALATPLSPAQGGTQIFYGGTSAGTNTVTISSTVPASFALTTGVHVVFIAGGTSTGLTTLNVNSTGAQNVIRKTQFGAINTAGGELIANNTYSLMFTGVAYVIEGETILVGEMKDYVAGVTPPPGWLIADGNAVSQATFPTLFAVVGFAFGNPGGGNFNLPDTRGRTLVGLDNYGTSTGAANRMTSPATGCGSTFTAIGATCVNGSQNHTQLLAEIAAHNHAITDPGHTHTVQGSSPQVIVTGSTVGGGTAAGSTGIVINSNTTGITINNTPAAVPAPIVNPNLGVVKIIRF